MSLWYRNALEPYKNTAQKSCGTQNFRLCCERYICLIMSACLFCAQRRFFCYVPEYLGTIRIYLLSFLTFTKRKLSKPLVRLKGIQVFGTASFLCEIISVCQCLNQHELTGKESLCFFLPVVPLRAAVSLILLSWLWWNIYWYWQLFPPCHSSPMPCRILCTSITQELQQVLLLLFCRPLFTTNSSS